MRVSRWNAPWDLMDPLLAMGGVDTSALKTSEMTFEVEVPPQDLDEEWTKEEMAEVFANFLRFCDAVRPPVATQQDR